MSFTYILTVTFLESFWNGLELVLLLRFVTTVKESYCGYISSNFLIIKVKNVI